MRGMFAVSIISLGIWASANVTGLEPVTHADPQLRPPPSAMWELASANRAKPRCRFALLGNDQDGARAIQIAKDCAAAHGLADAARWLVDGNGNVRIESQAGNTLAEFAAGEIDGYLSVFPQHTFLTVTRQ